MDRNRRKKSQLRKLNYSGSSGDETNTYFHGTVRQNSKGTSIQKLGKEEWSWVTEQKEIEQEVLKFYSKLVGESAKDLRSLNIGALRVGNRLSYAQRKNLVSDVTSKEMINVLKSIEDSKVLWADGYVTSPVVGGEVIRAFK